MRHSAHAAAIISLVGLALPLAPMDAEAQAQQGQQGPNVTLYGNGMALIDETRRLPASDGATIRLERVGPRMIADSVRLTLENGPAVQEIALDSDLLTPAALLRRALGKTVKVMRVNPATGAESTETAEVLSVNGPVLRFDDRVETGVPGRLVFDGVPADLNAEPVLSVRFAQPLAQPAAARLAYLTDGIQWDAVYTIELARDYGTLALDGWAKVTNGAGIDINDAALSLVAGDVRRETPQAPRPVLMRAEAMAADAKMAMPSRQEFAAYHLYAVPGRVTLRDRETKQLRLLSAAGVAAKRVLESRAGAQVWGPTRGPAQPMPVRQSVIFTNEKDGGQPLPGGLARVYVADAAGIMRFAGEDRIDNTPVGADVRLDLGNAFDVTVARTQTSFKCVADKTTEVAFTLIAANGGTAPAELRLQEDIGGDWEIIEQSRPSKREGGSAQWTVTVPAGGKTEITYKVRVRR